MGQSKLFQIAELLLLNIIGSALLAPDYMLANFTFVTFLAGCIVASVAMGIIGFLTHNEKLGKWPIHFIPYFFSFQFFPPIEGNIFF